MSFNVHLHVCIPADSNDGLAIIARKYLSELRADNLGDGERAARWFLEDLSSRSGKLAGPKGGLSLWGIVGNYTSPRNFVDYLIPFWLEVLGERFDGGPCRHEHIVVFYEREQSDAAGAIEIYLKEPYAKETALEIIEHESLPFSFGQY